jgi:cytochrome c oxidase subunit II
VTTRVLPYVLALPAVLLSGCSGWQSSLDPRGPQAEALTQLFWLFTAISAVVWVLVVIALAIALAHRHAPRPDPLLTDEAQERRFTLVVGTALGLTAVTLLALTGFSFATQQQLYGDKEGLTIKVTGYQWWWEVRYEDDAPSRGFTTANEIHIPVGEPVRIKLASSDVIHSFWVPNLFGKQDLITGHENEIRFVAERAGTYRGQCAEYCGLQHAHMSFLVIAEPREAFEAWRDHQIKPAEAPGDPDSQRGLQVFLSSPCASCHGIRGTEAAARVGPDLTHVASRRTIAAGTLPTSRGTIAAWIVDPQSIKPGNNMPLVKIEPDDLHLLVSYLEGLQ